MGSYDLASGVTITLTRPDGAETFEARLERRLGRGANSQTWLATSPSGSLALKAPLEDGDDHELTIEERIVRQFEHPSVVSLAGVGAGPGGRRVLAYERLFDNPLVVVSRPEVRCLFPEDPGGRYYPLPPPIVFNLAVDLFAAIEHIHRRGFVHHDVKADNLMIRVPTAPDRLSLLHHELLELVMAGKCEAVLVDLGSSRSKAYLAELNAGGSDADTLVIAPQVTPMNAAPEALLDNEVPGLAPRPLLFPSLDLYAAAVTIYGMVSGRAPYDHLGLETSGFDALREVKAAERAGTLLPFSAEAIAGAPGYRRFADDLLALLAACTHRDPAKRPGVAGALQFVEQLQRSLLPGAPRASRDDRMRALNAAAAATEPVEAFFGSTTRDRSMSRAKAWELRRSL